MIEEVVTAKMLRAAGDAEDLVVLLEEVDLPSIVAMSKWATNNHGQCEDGDQCQHLAKIQYVAYVVTDWQKRFLVNPETKGS